MTNLHLASLIALTLTLAASDAAAQSPPVADAAPSPGDDRPPAIVAAFEGAASAPAPAAVGYATLNLRGYHGKESRVYLLGTDNSHALLCDLPCTVDVPVGSELRATWGANEREPHTFRVPRSRRGKLDIEVRPADRGPLIGGLLLVAIGGSSIVVGGLMLVIGVGASHTRDGFGSDSSFISDSAAVLGVGAVALVSGIVVLTSRSREPRVVIEPTPAAQATYARRETAVGDAASAKRRDAAASAPAPLTPLTYGFSF